VQNGDRSGIRWSLKAATRDAHRKAEARWTDNGSFADRYSYDGWLKTMYVVHASLGQAAALTGCWSDAVEEEKFRLSCLAQDIGFSGNSSNTSSHELSPDEAWGVLYALNGSALGAQILLSEKSFVPEWPVAYLDAMRRFAKSGSLFTFFANLEIADIDTGSAIAGAKKVFFAITGCDPTVSPQSRGLA
jgi:heme oxygenase